MGWDALLTNRYFHAIGTRRVIVFKNRLFIKIFIRDIHEYEDFGFDITIIHDFKRWNCETWLYYS